MGKTEISEKDCSSKCCSSNTEQDSKPNCEKSNDEDHKKCGNDGMCNCTVCHHFISYFNFYLNIPTPIVPTYKNEVNKLYSALIEKDFQLTIFQPPKFTVIA